MTAQGREDAATGTLSAVETGNSVYNTFVLSSDSSTVAQYVEIVPNLRSHAICGETDCGHEGHTDVNYTALDNEDVTGTGDPAYGPTLKAGNYYLTADLTLSEPLVITSAVHICLNGNTLTFTDEDYGFHLGGGNANPEAQLTVCDCSAEETGKIVTTADDAQTIYNRSGDIFVYGGTISGEYRAIFTANHRDAGNVYIYGGKITTTGYIGAIYIFATDNVDRKLIISGGEIGEIYTYVPMEISGGTITDEVHAYGDMTVSGGEINRNVAAADDVTMTGGTLNGQLTINSSLSVKKNVKISGHAKIETASGNAIYSEGDIDLEISGGTISAPNGYAVFLTTSLSKIYLSGSPVISGGGSDLRVLPTMNADAAVLVLRAKDGTGSTYTDGNLSISSYGA